MLSASASAMDDKELFRQYRETHDIAVRNQIVEKYLYIAAVLAKKFVGRGVDFDDLKQVAALAIIKGVDRFDESLGVQFSTYITPTVTGEIKNYFRDRSRLVHLPRKIVELRLEAKRTANEIFAETGKSPSVKEIAARLQVSEEELVHAMEAGAVVSLDRTVDEDDDGMSFHEVIASDDGSFEEIEDRDAVRAAVSTLSPTERKIVDCRFMREMTQTETAKELGVSQMYVSRMERKVLEKLRGYVKTH